MKRDGPGRDSRAAKNRHLARCIIIMDAHSEDRNGSGSADGSGRAQPMDKQAFERSSLPALAFQPEGIPESLKELPVWICWRYETRRDDPKQLRTKVPYFVSQLPPPPEAPPFGWYSVKASLPTWEELRDWPDPENVWCTLAKSSQPYPGCTGFGTALRVLQRSDGFFDGLGVILSKDLGLTGVDLDDARSRATGELHPWAAQDC